MNKVSESEMRFAKKRIEVVLRRGAIVVSKTSAGQMAGLTKRRTLMVFDKYPELEAMRKESIKNIKAIAMQNTVDILMDKEHKDHYAATREIMKKFRTEFDDVLEANDPEASGTLAGATLQITFAKPEPDEEEG